jgi:hypothetical protein
MTGIRQTDNERSNRGSNVHDLFSVRNMFFFGNRCSVLTLPNSDNTRKQASTPRVLAGFDFASGLFRTVPGASWVAAPMAIPTAAALDLSKSLSPLVDSCYSTGAENRRGRIGKPGQFLETGISIRRFADPRPDGVAKSSRCRWFGSSDSGVLSSEAPVPFHL